MPRILIVDDDMFFRKVITKLLSGHEQYKGMSFKAFLHGKVATWD